MKFETIFQSWDTANKPTELSDFSVCTTWGLQDRHVYLLNVFRKRLDYPALKRAVREQAEAFNPQTILIEDKASGTQLIQELIVDGLHAIKKYVPTMDKIMRMHSVTRTIENGFVHLPEKAAWLNLQSMITRKACSRHCGSTTKWAELQSVQTKRDAAGSARKSWAFFSFAVPDVQDSD